MVHEDDAGRVGQEERRVSARMVVLVVLVALLLALGIDNSHEVSVEYLLGESDIALVWVILFSVVLGAVLERMYSFVAARRRRRD